MFKQSLALTSLAVAALCSAGVAGADSAAPGAVYTSTNAAAGNQVAVYNRDTDGGIKLENYFDTGGIGTDAGLGNQAGVVLSDDERFLFVVNAGSNDITSFAVRDRGLRRLQTISSRGLTPVSIAQRGRTLYVVNAGDDTIAGFHLRFDGKLVPIPGATANLSGSGVGPAQIAFSTDGTALYVTEKNTNLISVYQVSPIGIAANHTTVASAGGTPFGFMFGKRNQLFVSEAAGGTQGAGTLSSYVLDAQGMPNVVSPAVATGESATCWAIVDPSGRRAYVSNTGTNDISSFTVAYNGSLALANPQAGLTSGGPIDMAMTADGQYFYVLTSGGGDVSGYAVGANGDLTLIGSGSASLPASASGLAVR